MSRILHPTLLPSYPPSLLLSFSPHSVTLLHVNTGHEEKRFTSLLRNVLMFYCSNVLLFTFSNVQLFLTDASQLLTGTTIKFLHEFLLCFCISVVYWDGIHLLNSPWPSVLFHSLLPSGCGTQSQRAVLFPWGSSAPTARVNVWFGRWVGAVNQLQTPVNTGTNTGFSHILMTLPRPVGVHAVSCQFMLNHQNLIQIKRYIWTTVGLLYIPHGLVQ